MLGDLSQVSLAQLMRTMAQGRKSGLLSIWSDRGVHRIAFADGRIVAAISPEETGGLLQVLQTQVEFEPALLSRLAHDSLHEQALGNVLLAEKKVPSAQLKQAFNQQLEEACYPLFMLNSGQFRLSHTIQLPYEEMTGLDADPIQVALEGLRRMTSSTEGLGRLPQPDCMLQRADETLPAMPLTDIEKSVWKHLSSQKRLKDLSRYILASLLDVRQAAKHLLELQIIQQVREESVVV